MIQMNRYAHLSARSGRRILIFSLQIYVDTKDPTRTVSFNQARTIIRRLITGLRAAGVQVKDCVAIHAFNNVSLKP